MSLPKALVILGAGASRDVWNGTGSINGAWTPPLARTLFGQFGAANPEYEKILLEYRGAKVLAQEIVPLTPRDDFNVEEVLRRFAEHTGGETRRAYLEVPPYLRHLLFEISRSYCAFPGTYTQLVRALFEENPHEIMFVVLNYDTLLEQAISDISPSHTFLDMSDYLGASRQIHMVKLHGSINWGIPIGNFRTQIESRSAKDEWLACLETQTVESLRTATPLVVPSATRAACWEWSSTGNVTTRQHLYPKLTAPLARKTVDDIVCPPDHVELLRRFATDCRKYLVVGCSGLDDDLVALLGESVAAVDRLDFVSDSDKHALDSYERFQQGVRSFALTSPRLSGEGFRNYVNTPQFREFIDA